jgi:asparagine synthase (glutamine-hydrolysing)
MCGIAGLISKKSLQEKSIDEFLQATKVMNHRGPDYSSHVKFKNCLLVHYRLSILDPDPRSNQPYQSGNGRYTCSYNGEIYNFRDLKKEYILKTKTNSDTEVMLETYVKDGFDAVKKWNGIFAMAILDKQNEHVHLIRDRFGIKPLYIYEDENCLAFASEQKVIYEWLDGFELNRKGIAEYLWYGNTISENTMSKKVIKMDPASVYSIDLNNVHLDSRHHYWSLPQKSRYNSGEGELIKNVQHLLEQAVERQLVSDVPLGVLLSGGIDSSAIVAYASRYIDNLDTYSIEYDFNIGGESELGNAALIAKKFNTNHHELKAGADDIIDIFDKLVYQYDDPFSDAANIPLYLLAKACGEDKTVILQGDGGDEFFGGYRRYNVLDWEFFWKITSTLAYKIIPSNEWSIRMKRISNILKQDDAMKMALYITEDVPYESPYDILTPEYKDSVSSEDPFEAYKRFNEEYENVDIVQRMMFADVHILLNHTYLEKVDKATMLCSMEARVPFLDNELTDFMLNLPSSYKVRRGQKKYLLKKALRGLIPDQILDGKKRGFDVPYKLWLKEGLYDFAMSTFEESRNGNILAGKKLIDLMLRHKKGEGNYGPLLWKALVLAHWLKIYENKIRIQTE